MKLEIGDWRFGRRAGGKRTKRTEGTERLKELPWFRAWDCNWGGWYAWFGGVETGPVRGDGLPGVCGEFGARFIRESNCAQGSLTRFCVGVFVGLAGGGPISRKNIGGFVIFVNSIIAEKEIIE